MAVLAFPPSSPSDLKWRQAELALCRAILLTKQQIDPDWAAQAQLVVPEHLIFPVNGLEKKLSKIQELHGHRMAAAHIAIPYFKKAVQKGANRKASRTRTISIDARIQKTIEQEADREDWLTELKLKAKPRIPKDGHNLEQRVFRPSLPVLHIAVAVAVAIDQSQKFLKSQPKSVKDEHFRDMAGSQIHFADFLLNPDLAHRTAAMSLEYEKFIPQMAKPKIQNFVSLVLPKM